MPTNYVPEGMKIDDDLDALKFTSETNRGLHKQRQTYEFRVVFTTLSFYVLMTSAVLGNKVSLMGLRPFTAAIWIIFLLTAGVASAHLFRIHRGNRINLDVAKNAELAIIALLANKGIRVLPGYLSPDRAMKRARVEVNWVFQTAIMFLFAVGGAIIVTSVLEATMSSPGAT